MTKGKYEEQLRAKAADRSALIGIVGLGYVGLPLAREMARAGYRVLGFDVSARVVDGINAGRSHIQDVASEQLAGFVRDGKIAATADLSRMREPDCIAICVPTPLSKTRDPDVSFIVAATESVANSLRAGQVIVLESTTYPGTTRELMLPALEARGLKVGEDFFLAFSPERVDPGNPKYGTRNTPKVVGGVTPACTRVTVTLYQPAIDLLVPVSSPEAAELVKLLENTFRSINIGLVNEMAVICDKLGVDVWEVIEAAATKPFGFMKFTPGPGVGGHCLPIDPSYLAWRVKQHLGHTFRFVELANDVNEHMPDYVHARVTAMLNRQRKSVNGSKVLLLGLAYKKGTSDWRESPSVAVAERLAASGAEITFCDPYIPAVNATHMRFPLVPFGPEHLTAADVVVVLVDHPEFDPAVIAAHGTMVFDTKNLMRGHEFSGEVL